jgi:hypothetical protein
MNPVAIFASLLCMVAVAAVACGRPESPPRASRVERGRYIVNSFGCTDCHSPKVMGPTGPAPDPTRAFSGHPEGEAMPAAPASQGPWIVRTNDSLTAWTGPWGTSFPANLTPDRETGLGTWTEDTFVKTVRTGRHMGQGREILPPMPIEQLAHMDDDDLRSIFAYLRSLPPVKNRVPAPVPPVPAAPPASK